MAALGYPRTPTAVEGSAGGSFRRTSPFVPQRFTADVGGQIAGALDAIRADIEEDVARAEALEADEARLSFQEGLAVRTSELDPRAPDYLDRVASIAEEEQTRVRANLRFSNPDLKNRFDLSLAQASGQARISAHGARREALQVEAVARVEDASKQALASIFERPEAFDGVVADFGARMAVMSAALPANARDEMARNFAEAAVVQQVTGFARKGRLGEAEATLKASRGQLDPNKAYSLDNIIMGERRRIEAEGRARQAEAQRVLAARVAAGEVGPEEEAELVKRGVLKPGAAKAGRDLKNGMDSTQAAKDAAIVERIAAGQPVTAAEVDRGFDLFFARAAEAVTDEIAEQAGLSREGIAAAQTAVQLFQQTGVVPKQFKAYVSGAERSNDPSRLAEAALIRDQLRRLTLLDDPGLGVGDRVLAVSAAAHDLAGLSPPTVEHYRSAASTVLTMVSPAEQAARSKAVQSGDAFRGMDTPANALKDAGLERDALALAEFEEHRAGLYRVTGDAAAAHNIALERVAASRPVSLVGGFAHRPGRVTPEMALPTELRKRTSPEEQAAIVTAEVSRRLAGAGVLLPPAGEDGLPRFKMRAADTPGADGRPQFHIMVRLPGTQQYYPVAAEQAETGERVPIYWQAPQTFALAAELPEVGVVVERQRETLEQAEVERQRRANREAAFARDRELFGPRRPSPSFPAEGFDPFSAGRLPGDVGSGARDPVSGGAVFPRIPSLGDTGFDELGNPIIPPPQ